MTKILYSLTLYLFPVFCYAGCPALPPVEIIAKVNGCNVYSFANSVASQEAFERYLDTLSAEAAQLITERIENTLQGVILDVELIQQGPNQTANLHEINQLFYRYKNADFCNHIQQNIFYTLHIYRSCPMVFFDIPAGIGWYVGNIAPTDGIITP